MRVSFLRDAKENREKKMTARNPRGPRRSEERRGTTHSWYDSIELPPLLFQCWFLISPLFQEEAFPIRASIVVTFKILNIEFSHLNVTLNIVIITARSVVKLMELLPFIKVVYIFKKN